MAYSSDLRQKIVEAYCEKKLGSKREIAELFSVSESTIKRWVYRYRDEGHVNLRAHGGGRQPLLNDEEREILYNLQLDYPDATIKELSRKLKNKIDKDVNKSTMSRELIKLELTRKKNVSSRSKKDRASKKTSSRVSRDNPKT